MSELPDLATFSPCVGESFAVEFEGAELPRFELTEAAALPVHKGAPRQDPFSLVFRAPGTCDVRQGTYVVQHERIGELPVFLVPIGKDEEGLYFQAVFN
jgi:hypothetical protein